MLPTDTITPDTITTEKCGTSIDVNYYLLT